MKHAFAIAVDLDETLAATYRSIFELGQKKHGWDLSFEQIVEHDWWNIPGLGITRAQAFSLFDDYYTMNPTDATIPPVPWAREGVLKLLQMGADPYIVTARTESIRGNATKAWLKKNLPEIDYERRVHFTNHYQISGAQSKGEICRSIKASILIDDNIEFLDSASTFDIHGILLEKPWNRTRKVAGKITRASCWEEIPTIVNWIRKNFH